MVHANHPVPDVVVREIGEIELRPRVDVHRPAAILVDAFEVDEEVKLVLDDGPSQVSAPLLLLRFRLREIPLLGEIIERRHRLVLIEEERGAVHAVGPLLRDRVHDAA